MWPRRATLRAKGAPPRYACATHGSVPPARPTSCEENSCIEEVVVTNAVPVLAGARQTGKIKVFPSRRCSRRPSMSYNNGSIGKCSNSCLAVRPGVPRGGSPAQNSIEARIARGLRGLPLHFNELQRGPSPGTRPTLPKMNDGNR